MPYFIYKYQVALNILLLLLILLCIAICVGNHYRVKKEKNREKREINKEKKEKIKEKKEKYIIRRNFWLYGVAIGISIIFIMNCYINQFKIDDHFFWEYDSNIRIEEIFVSYAREKTEKSNSQNSKPSHIDWLYQGEKKEQGDTLIVTKDMIEYYEDNVYLTYAIIPFKEDVIRQDDADEGFSKKREQFNDILKVGNYSSLTSDELWESFLVGKEVCAVNDTSRNVYQTAMLAEAAHFVSSNKESAVDTYIYLEGAMEMFEESLQFTDYIAGVDGEGIPKKYTNKDIVLKIGVMNLRESRKYRKKDVREAVEKHIHCSLYGYSCFRYVLVDMQPTEEKYIDCLYNECLCCLEFLPYISDKQLSEKLAREELEKLEGLDAVDNISFSREKLENVKKLLRHYLN